MASLWKPFLQLFGIASQEKTETSCTSFPVQETCVPPESLTSNQPENVPHDPEKVKGAAAAVSCQIDVSAEDCPPGNRNVLSGVDGLGASHTEIRRNAKPHTENEDITKENVTLTGVDGLGASHSDLQMNEQGREIVRLKTDLQRSESENRDLREKLIIQENENKNLKAANEFLQNNAKLQLESVTNEGRSNMTDGCVNRNEKVVQKLEDTGIQLREKGDSLENVLARVTRGGSFSSYRTKKKNSVTKRSHLFEKEKRRCLHKYIARLPVQVQQNTMFPCVDGNKEAVPYPRSGRPKSNKCCSCPASCFIDCLFRLFRQWDWKICYTQFKNTVALNHGERLKCGHYYTYFLDNGLINEVTDGGIKGDLNGGLKKVVTELKAKDVCEFLLVLKFRDRKTLHCLFGRYTKTDDPQVVVSVYDAQLREVWPKHVEDMESVERIKVYELSRKKLAKTFESCFQEKCQDSTREIAVLYSL